MILGRAGRRNSRFPKGYVTCMNPKDMPILQAALNTPLSDLHTARAGIQFSPFSILQIILCYISYQLALLIHIPLGVCLQDCCKHTQDYCPGLLPMLYTVYGVFSTLHHAIRCCLLWVNVFLPYLKQITLAGLFPEFEHFEAYAGKTLISGFSKLIELFAAESRLDGVYFFCKQQSLVTIDELLGDIKNLSLQVCNVRHTTIALCNYQLYLQCPQKCKCFESCIGYLYLMNQPQQKVPDTLQANAPWINVSSPTNITNWPLISLHLLSQPRVWWLIWK